MKNKKGNAHATNKSAIRDYEIFESLECGIELKGMEVKSLRETKTDLRDSFARIEDKGVVLYNMYIAPYEKTGAFGVGPRRPRRLLLHKRQIQRLANKVNQRGFSLIPLKLYFKAGLAKIELALARGKRLYEKRASIKKRQQEMEIRRVLRRRR